MTDKEIRVLNSLDIRKLNSDGRYVDVEIPLFFNLNYEQVQYLRRKYNDNTIAANVKRPREVATGRREIPRESAPRYKVTRDQRYNTGRHRTKKRVAFDPVRKLIIGALVVSLSAGIFINLSKGKDNGRSNTNSPDVISVVDDKSPSLRSSSDFVVSADDIIASGSGISIVDGEASYEEKVTESEELEEAVVVENEIIPVMEEQNQVNGDIIRELCDIYHVNFDVVYPFIKSITNDFTSEQFVSGCLEGVTCKGEQVVANSDKELLIYTVRAIKQLPFQVGISTDGLYNNSGYQSSTDYLSQISKAALDLGVNRCLMYAIVQAETSFNSDLFVGSNNPAGIRTDGHWWVFDTKEEGFYELGMELLKYYRKIGVSPSVVDNGVLAKIRDIHAPLSDGNEHWLPNVIENYEYAVMNEATLFGTVEQSLSR